MKRDQHIQIALENNLKNKNKKNNNKKNNINYPLKKEAKKTKVKPNIETNQLNLHRMDEKCDRWCRMHTKKRKTLTKK